MITMQTQLTHDQLKTQFKIPVTFKDQKEMGFADEPFKLVIESAQDGDRVAREAAAKAKAKADAEAASPLFAAVQDVAIADCGCTKYKLCPAAVRLAQVMRPPHYTEARAIAYSQHRTAAQQQIKAINKSLVKEAV